MGGHGSGRWKGQVKKDLVEDCLALDASRWTREGILREGVWQSGGWEWRNTWGKKVASIGYVVNTLDPTRPVVHLVYALTLFSGEKEEIDEPVPLQTTRPHFGGVRWWFTCPLLVNGKPCRRRVRKLYRPPGGRYFGCRQCCGLTYRSVQEHDRRVDALLRNPAGWECLPVRDKLSWLNLVWKAARRRVNLWP